MIVSVAKMYLQYKCVEVTQGGEAKCEEMKSMPSSAFRSGSQQRHKGSHSDTPGVGSYRPKREAVEPNSRNVGHGMRAKDERFKYDKPPTDDNVGPGLYDYGEFMSTELEKSLTKTSKGGSAFGTRRPPTRPQRMRY